MEGLFDPHQFPLPKSIDRNRLLKSIVKVSPIRKLEYQFFSSESAANEFSQTFIDQDGFETIRYGLIDTDRDSASNPEFSEALFTHEFCELLKNGASFPATAMLKGNGNGILISDDGYIITNYHLVSGAVELHNATTTGYFEDKPKLIKNIDIEVLATDDTGEHFYKKAKEVFLISSFSKTDAYGKKKDLALLKINEKCENYLNISKSAPKKFDKIFSVGFSMRTDRREEQLKRIGYQNANYDLRISTGLITQLEENSFLADTDGAPGNSGSAAIDEDGNLVGVYCGSTGNGIVDPSKSYRRYVNVDNISLLMKV